MRPLKIKPIILIIIFSLLFTIAITLLVSRPAQKNKIKYDTDNETKTTETTNQETKKTNREIVSYKDDVEWKDFRIKAQTPGYLGANSTYYFNAPSDVQTNIKRDMLKRISLFNNDFYLQITPIPEGHNKLFIKSKLSEGYKILNNGKEEYLKRPFTWKQLPSTIQYKGDKFKFILDYKSYNLETTCTPTILKKYGFSINECKTGELVILSSEALIKDNVHGYNTAYCGYNNKRGEYICDNVIKNFSAEENL